MKWHDPSGDAYKTMAENGLEHLSASDILATIGEQAGECVIALWIAAQIGNTVERDADRRDLV